jgi:hypothetical protein
MSLPATFYQPITAILQAELDRCGGRTQLCRVIENADFLSGSRAITEASNKGWQDNF